MSGYEFDPKDKDGSLRDRFDCYCKEVIGRAAHNLVFKQAQYLILHFGGGEIDPSMMMHEDEHDNLFPTMKTLKSENNEAHADEKAGEEKSSEAVSDQSGFFTPNEKIDFTGVKIEPLFADQVDFDTFSKSDFRAVKVKECSAVPKSKKLLKFVLDDGTGTDRVILSGIHAYYEPEELVGKTLIAITNLPPRAMMGIDSCGMLLSAVNERNGEEELHLLMVDNHIPAGAKLY